MRTQQQHSGSADVGSAAGGALCGSSQADPSIPGLVMGAFRPASGVQGRRIAAVETVICSS
jgi:hypothetical protein